MINHRELIGNYFTVAHESNSPIIKVKSFHDGMVYDENGKAIELSLILPIALTIDWLTNFKFKEIDEMLYRRRWRLNRVDIHQMINGKYPFYFRFNQVDLKIKYVHQLQTLYFGLTEKELEIK